MLVIGVDFLEEIRFWGGRFAGDDLSHDVAGIGEELADGDVWIDADALIAGALLAEVPFDLALIIGDDDFVDCCFV